MIPRAYIQEWSQTAPWPDPAQVEQDLIICRALCDLFRNEWLAALVEQEIAGLNVPMHQPLLVGVVQRLGNRRQ